MVTGKLFTDVESKKVDLAPTALVAPHADSRSLYSTCIGQEGTLSHGDPPPTSHLSSERILLEKGRADIAPDPRVTQICARPRCPGGGTAFSLTEVVSHVVGPKLVQFQFGVLEYLL
jgi:hypothetical protein